LSSSSSSVACSCARERDRDRGRYSDRDGVVVFMLILLPIKLLFGKKKIVPKIFSAHSTSKYSYWARLLDRDRGRTCDRQRSRAPARARARGRTRDRGRGRARAGLQDPAMRLISFYFLLISSTGLDIPGREHWAALSL
jgi:hypothetical protein